MALDVSQVNSGPQTGSDTGGASSTQEASTSGGGSAGQPTTQAREAPSTSPASGGDSGAATADRGTAETGTTQSTEASAPDWRSRPPEEILREHPTLKRFFDSRVGDLANRQAEARLKQIQDDSQLREKLEYRRKLRESDPEAFAKYDAEQESLWETEHSVRQRVEAETQQKLLTGFDNMLFGIQFSLPVEAQREVEGQTFQSPTGDIWESRRMYIDALTKAAIKHGVNGALGPALQKARGEITEAARGEANGAARSSNPALNTGSGEAPSAAYVSQSEWDQNRGNREWRKQNKERIDRSIGSHITY